LSLAPGQRVGPYEITAKLGQGGMGEVWRATDSRLKRDVAIKVLPTAFTADESFLRRFEREAQLLAQLHHPHIASIFGLEEADGGQALVMELVEGPTLAERLQQGALPIDETISIARQIAEALETAHEKGIIHRDLKPQNIKAPREGKVKVLDFGLAKAFDPAGAPVSGSDSYSGNSPTLTLGATAQGVILGTAPYMSPEQAKGGTVDKRADIWAFGVVLWEMLVGHRLFEGESVAETLGAVFRQEVRFDELPAQVPATVRQLAERCLARDPRLRLRDIGEARIALSDAAVLEPASATGEAGAAPRSWRRALPWALAAVAVLAATVAAVRPPRLPSRSAAPEAMTAFGVPLPAGFVMASDEAPVLDLSRDGRLLVFEASGETGRQLFRRRLDRVEAEPIEGTIGAAQPFLSPDGRWIGFYAGGRIQKVAIQGGRPIDLANVNACRGAAWTKDGWIVYTQTYSGNLLRVREAGGVPETVTTLDVERQERTHRWPSAIDGSPWVLFSVGISKNPSFYDDARIDAVRLDTGERHTVYEGAWTARFAPPSTLLVQRRTSLFALPFDPQRAEVTGPERLLLEGVGGEASSGAGYFAAGAQGSLAYVPGEALSEEKAIALVELGGEETLLPLDARNYWYPRFSDDGRMLALDLGSGQGSDDDIWLYELASERLSRFTFAPASMLPAWSPDGRWIAYGGAQEGRNAKVLRKRVDGIGDEELVWQGNDIVVPMDWSPDGRSIVATDSTSGIETVLISLEDGEGQPYLSAAGEQWGAAFSPDGDFIAYTTTETGLDEVFVSSFPAGSGKWQVSVEGGQQPVWSRDGRSLFYVRSDAIWRANIEIEGAAFRASTPREVLRGPYILRTAPWRNFDVGPGDRFVLIRRRTDRILQRHLEVVLGWEALLEGEP
jgi:Protein kinase domain/WD40-like Beta Propeller Repeat